MFHHKTKKNKKEVRAALLFLLLQCFAISEGTVYENQHLKKVRTFRAASNTVCLDTRSDRPLTELKIRLMVRSLMYGKMISAGEVSLGQELFSTSNSTHTISIDYVGDGHTMHLLSVLLDEKRTEYVTDEYFAWSTMIDVYRFDHIGLFLEGKANVYKCKKKSVFSHFTLLPPEPDIAATAAPVAKKTKAGTPARPTAAPAGKKTKAGATSPSTAASVAKKTKARGPSPSTAAPVAKKTKAGAPARPTAAPAPKKTIARPTTTPAAPAGKKTKPGAPSTSTGAKKTKAGAPAQPTVAPAGKKTIAGAPARPTTTPAAPARKKTKVGAFSQPTAALAVEETEAGAPARPTTTPTGKTTKARAPSQPTDAPAGEKYKAGAPTRPSAVPAVPAAAAKKNTAAASATSAPSALNKIEGIVPEAPAVPAAKNTSAASKLIFPKAAFTMPTVATTAAVKKSPATVSSKSAFTMLETTEEAPVSAFPFTQTEQIYVHNNMREAAKFRSPRSTLCVDLLSMKPKVALKIKLMVKTSETNDVVSVGEVHISTNPFLPVYSTHRIDIEHIEHKNTSQGLKVLFDGKEVKFTPRNVFAWGEDNSFDHILLLLKGIVKIHECKTSQAVQPTLLLEATTKAPSTAKTLAARRTTKRIATTKKTTTTAPTTKTLRTGKARITLPPLKIRTVARKKVASRTRATTSTTPSVVTTTAVAAGATAVADAAAETKPRIFFEEQQKGTFFSNKRMTKVAEYYSSINTICVEPRSIEAKVSLKIKLMLRFSASLKLFSAGETHIKNTLLAPVNSVHKIRIQHIWNTKELKVLVDDKRVKFRPQNNTISRSEFFSFDHISIRLKGSAVIYSC